MKNGEIIIDVSSIDDCKESKLIVPFSHGDGRLLWKLVHRKLRSKLGTSLESKNDHEWYGEYAIYAKYPEIKTRHKVLARMHIALMKNGSDFMKYFKQCTKDSENESGPTTVPVEIKVE